VDTRAPTTRKRTAENLRNAKDVDGINITGNGQVGCTQLRA
jgi:hypothetical protein